MGCYSYNYWHMQFMVETKIEFPIQHLKRIRCVNCNGNMQFQTVL